MGDEMERYEDEEFSRQPKRESSILMKRTSGSPLANVMYWLTVEFIVLWIFRYMLLAVSDHDILDFDDQKNRVLYLVLIGGTLWWLKEQMSVEGLHELGERYNKKYKDHQLAKIKKDTDTYQRQQAMRRTRREALMTR
jgi:hypothetical protein